MLACETRPLLQGARLTIWELRRAGVPHELLVDGAAAGLIRRGEVDAVIVGCDRVAANGDVANKVGTYAHALAARAAGIPFVVAGPTSTIDAAIASGDEIDIEERDADEVRHAGGALLTVAGHAVPQPGVRRDAGGARHGARHRARDRRAADARVGARAARGAVRRAVQRGLMRVARSLTPREVVIEEAADPVAGPGEVVCRVLACGVCGSDVSETYVARKLPGVLGHEVVGEVLSPGSGRCAGVAVGDRVVVHHHVPCGECRRCRRGHETLCEQFRCDGAGSRAASPSRCG